MLIERIQRLLVANDWTQEEAARLCGQTQPRISYGRAYAFEGSHMACRKNCVIVEGFPRSTLPNGRPQVIHGMMTSNGCPLIEGMTESDGKTQLVAGHDGDTLDCEIAKEAEPRGLPVKLTTGVRTYRNMEIYDPSEHDRYASNIYGFSEMVMLSCGAPNMQRVGVNTVTVAAPEELQPGDILAQEADKDSERAHHIQVVVSRTSDTINIYQGNSGIGNWASLLFRAFLRNPADPRDSSYTGQPIEVGCFTASPLCQAICRFRSG